MFRLSDVAILLICTLILLFESQHNSIYRLDNAFSLMSRRDGFTIQPVIADVDGDLKQDIVIAGHGGSHFITIFSYENGHFLEKAHNSIRQATGIPLEVEIQKISVASLTGLNFGPKHVIVVTNNLDLIVLDNTLNVVWFVGIPDPARDARFVDTLEIALIGLDFPIWQGDQSLIVVGVRAHQEDLIERNKWKHEADFIKENDNNKDNNNNNNNNKGNDNNNEDHEIQTSNHFNYYAFEGISGELRWKYQVLRENDWEEQDSLGNVFMSPHSWKMHVASQKHFETQPWENFHESILSSLPHKWYIPDDTMLQLAHYEKLKIMGKKSGKKGYFPEVIKGSYEKNLDEHKWDSEAVGVSSKYLPSFLTQQETHTMIKNPNVIVSHTSLGIDVIHLYTGRLLTQMVLRSHALYDDFDYDSNIDQIWTRVGREALQHRERDFEAHSGHFAACSALFGSGVPNARRIISNLTLCNRGGLFSKVKVEEDVVGDATNPIVINCYDSHFIKEYIPTTKHAIFLTNDGTLTSISQNYAHSWQISLDIKWDPIDRLFREVFPTLTKFNLHNNENNFRFDIFSQFGKSFFLGKIYSEDDAILICAEKILIVSSSGSVIASVNVGRDAYPDSYPVVGDINNDGINDIVIRSRRGYSVYLLQGTGSYFFPVILGIILCVIFAVFVQNGIRFQNRLKLEKEIQIQQQQQQGQFWVPAPKEQQD